VQDINNWILFFATKEKQFKIVIKYFEYIDKHIKIVKEIVKKT
jgi:hypothetical protein